MERRKFLRNFAASSVAGTSALSGVSLASGCTTDLEVHIPNYDSGEEIKYYIGTIGTDVTCSTCNSRDDITINYNSNSRNTAEMTGYVQGGKDRYTLGPETKVADLKATTTAYVGEPA